ncbi:MAG: flagellin lysine-N-methylase [Oscillospiraceae bacterium]|nr:flagellin lysine-N-methylase [Oscillospiraceae bacterium]
MGKKVFAQFFKQPKFYKDFHCIGGNCPVSCCHNWNIDYKFDDVEKLKTAECSDNLKKLINESFEYYSKRDCLVIKLTDDDKCPFHNEEGLCAIQKELGEGYLSNTCKVYPRKLMYYGSFVLRSCSISCPHVLSMICSDEDSMDLETTLISKNAENVMMDSDIANINNPALQFREIIFDFFYEILSEKKRSIETSIVLGALAAQKLDEYIKLGKYDRIPEVIKYLKPQLNNPSQIVKLESAKTNLSLKANFSAGLIHFLRNTDVYKSVFEKGIPSEEKYNLGMENFKAHFNSTNGFLRNIALRQHRTTP